MAYSQDTYIGDGATQTFSVTFGYIQKTHVKVYVDGVEDTTFTWPTDSSVLLTSIPVADAVVLIDRDTPTTRLVDFTSASNITETDLDNDSFQALYVALEAFDAGSGALNSTLKSYVQGLITTSGNVPTPANPGDDDKVLTASGGTAAWQQAGLVSTPVNPTDDDKVLKASAGTYAWTAIDEVPAQTTGQDDGKVLTSDSGADSWAVPIKLDDGFICSRNATNPTTDIDITAGATLDTTDAYLLKTTSTFVKQLDVAWSEGTAAGGLDTGVIAASTLYAVWAIYNPTTFLTDFLFSTSFTVAGLTLPTGYTAAELVWCVLTDGSSTIVDFEQQGNLCSYLETHPSSFASDSTWTTSVFKNKTVTSAPPDSLAHMSIDASNDGTMTVGYIWLRHGQDTTSGTQTSRAVAGLDEASIVASVQFYGPVKLDTNRQFGMAVLETSGTTTVDAFTHRFEMLTRFQGA